MTVHFVLPGDVDDPAEPSGGNVYDRRVIAAAGGALRELPVPGTWPVPDAATSARLADALDALPDGATALLDGLCACGAPEVLVPRAGRLRLAVLVHLPLADETGLSPEAAADLADRERRVLTAASLVVTTSPWAARSVAERHGIPAERIRTVVPGVSWTGARASPGDGGRLLCVASVTPRKAQDVLIEALAGLADLPWHCTSIGPLTRDAEYTALVRTLIDTHGLADRVTLRGPLSGAALDAAYLAADLLVLPSRAETYGMVITEALARGIPAIASNTGGIPDALSPQLREAPHLRTGTPHPRTDPAHPGGEPPRVQPYRHPPTEPGVLVPPDDPPALATALRRWLTDADHRAALRAAATATRPRTWDQAATELLAAVTP